MSARIPRLLRAFIRYGYFPTIGELPGAAERATRSPIDALKSWRWGELHQAVQVWIAAQKIDHSHLLAEQVMADRFTRDRRSIFLHPDQLVTEPNVAIYLLGRSLLRNVAGTLPFLEQRKLPFEGRDFLVPGGVFAPRLESQHLLHAASAGVRFLHSETPALLHVLDTCCGTGNIGITLAMENRQRLRSVHMVDHAAEAVAAARVNISRLGMEAHTRVLQDNLFPESMFLGGEVSALEYVTGIPFSLLQVLPSPHLKQLIRSLHQGEGRSLLPDRSYYDIIVGNPPYYPIHEAPVGRWRWFRHRPINRQWYAENDGLAVIHSILHRGRNWIRPNGLVFLEMMRSQGARAIEMAHALGWQSAFIFEQQRGNSCVFGASRRAGLTAAALDLKPPAFDPKYLSPRRADGEADARRLLRYATRELAHIRTRFYGHHTLMDTAEVERISRACDEEIERERLWESGPHPSSFRVASLHAQMAATLERSRATLNYLNSDNLERCEHRHVSIETAIKMLVLLEALERVMPQLERTTFAEGARRQMRLTLDFLFDRPNEFGERVSQAVTSHWRSVQTGLTYYLSKAEPLA